MRTSIVVHEGFSQELKNRAPQLFVIVLFESLETANERLEKERHIRSHQTLRGQNLSLRRALKRFIYLPWDDPAEHLIDDRKRFSWIHPCLEKVGSIGAVMEKMESCFCNLPDSEVKAQSNSFRKNGLNAASFNLTTTSKNVEMTSFSTWRCMKLVERVTYSCGLLTDFLIAGVDAKNWNIERKVA